MNTISIAQIQFPIKNGEIRENIDKAFSLIEKALSRQKIDYLIMPEMWSTGFISKKEIINNIESTDYILKKLSQIAKHYQSHIICGTLPNLENNKLFNTSFTLSPEGKIIGKYSKRKLFPGIREDNTFTAGNSTGIINTTISRIGIAICFDLRFPELFSELSEKGAEIIFIPAQFPNPRLDHWITLLKARAIENQLYIVSSNTIEQSGKLEFFGNSVIVDPWGEIISNMEQKYGYQITTIDRSRVKKTRDAFPMHKVESK